jgi:hypothetical protein
MRKNKLNRKPQKPKRRRPNHKSLFEVKPLGPHPLVRVKK